MNFVTLGPDMFQVFALNGSNPWKCNARTFPEGSSIRFEGTSGDVMLGPWFPLHVQEVNPLSGLVIINETHLCNGRNNPDAIQLDRVFRGLSAGINFVRVVMIAGPPVRVALSQEGAAAAIEVDDSYVDVHTMQTNYDPQASDFGLSHPAPPQPAPRRRSTRSQYGNSDIETQTASKIPGIMEYWDNIGKKIQYKKLKKKSSEEDCTETFSFHNVRPNRSNRRD